MLSMRMQLYEDREDVTLTTYVLDDSVEMLKGKVRPAVLICPGGAYLSCSDREGEPIAMRFAAMGYHAFVLRYSVYFEGKGWDMNPNASLEVNPHSIEPAPMRDIAKAMLTIRDHAAEWLVDTDRVAVCGFSAGAHNCAMYSVYWDKPVITGYFNRPKEDFKPAAAILGYMLSDYIMMKEQTMDEMGRGLFNLSSLAFTGTPEPDDETLLRISPARQVSASTPPMFLWATAGDSLVPVEHTTRMSTALAQNKIPFEVHIFEEGQHGLSTSNQASAGAKDQLNADAEKWMELAEMWLRKRFAFDLPESSAWEA